MIKLKNKHFLTFYKFLLQNMAQHVCESYQKQNTAKLRNTNAFFAACIYIGNKTNKMQAHPPNTKSDQIFKTWLYFLF